MKKTFLFVSNKIREILYKFDSSNEFETLKILKKGFLFSLFILSFLFLALAFVTADQTYGNGTYGNLSYSLAAETILANSTNITLDVNITSVLVPDGHNITNLNVPETVASDKLINIDFFFIAESNSTETTVTLNNNLTLSRNTSTIDYEVEIPQGTVITGPADWPGIINVPTVKVATTQPTTTSGMTTTISQTIELGFGDVKLTLDNAARLVITGQAGKLVGYSRSGVFYKITNVCAGDNQSVGNNLTEGGECKFDVGSDLVIWTKHFTEFTTYTQTAIPTTSTTTSSSGSGSSCGVWSDCINDEQTQSCYSGLGEPYIITRACTSNNTLTPAPTTPVEEVTSTETTTPTEPTPQPSTATKPSTTPTGQVIGETGYSPSWWMSILALIVVIGIIISGYFIFRKPDHSNKRHT